MHLYLVLAGRSLRSREDYLRAWSCPLHEGDPRRQGEERQDRCPENSSPVARRHDPGGLRLSRTDAFDPRSAAPANADDASTCAVAGSCPKHEPSVQSSGYRGEDLLSRKPG